MAHLSLKWVSSIVIVGLFYRADGISLSEYTVVAEQQKWTQNLCNLDAKIEYYATMSLTTDQTEF